MRGRNQLGIAIAGILGTAGFVVPASFAQDANATASSAKGEEVEEVVVTGFRRSLAESTEAKRNSVGFTDSIFTEDIGKFPDTNLAESFNRIPGITITREITGEGLNVAIRGLNTNFTRVLLNNAPIAISSTGQDNASQNREVDLDMFPSELFSQLTVSKTPTPELIEGGAAGTINMRMARPFDNEGSQLTYQVQGIDNSEADDTGLRGSLVGSWSGEKFGVLAGFAGLKNHVATSGFETIGWASLVPSAAQCGQVANPMAPCNSTGGNGPAIPATVPNPGNASTNAAGLTPGATIDNAFLLAQNPGLTTQQIDNALIPRLGRPMFDIGEKTRISGAVSFEFRPSDDLHFFMDNMYGKKENDLERADMMWAVRRTSQGGLVIPTQMQVDRDDCVNSCLVTSGTFVNSQIMLEYRPYFEELEFWGTNPGMEWQISDKLKFDIQGNYTKSEFHREDPTVLVVSPATTITYTNDGDIPTLVSSLDMNDPATFRWSTNDRGAYGEVGRVDMVDEKRETETMGGRFALTFGDDKLNLKVGGAYDEVSRDIRPISNTGQYQAAVCGGNPSVYVPGPNNGVPCRGNTAAEIAAEAGRPFGNGATQTPYPTYPGLGTGYTAGSPTPISYGGSLIPNAAVPSYLRPTKYGFVTVDWPSFRDASNYDEIHALSGETGSTPTTANWATIQEDVGALFAQVAGDAEVGTNRLRYNIGVRYVQTDQTITSRLTAPDPRNPTTAAGALTPESDGGRYPDVATISVIKTDYDNVLPSASLAWNVTDSAVVRVGLSRTMTRPNPGAMRAGISVPNADASSASLGNPNLVPYISDNIDLGFEYYTGGEGYFSFAAFRKELTGFTITRQTQVPFGSLAQYGLVFASLSPGQQANLAGRTVPPGGDPNTALIRLDETLNAPGKLFLNGLEFGVVQPLDFGVAALEGLGITANYTFIDQRGEGAAPAIAVGVPPQTYNATLYYENHGVSARVSITSADGSQNSGPASNQQGVTGAELYGVGYKQVDFSSSFDFGEMFGWSEFVPQLTIDVINVTEESRRSYSYFRDAVFTEFDSGRTIMVGLRGRF
jgi:TonB-dependent receptor